MLVMVVVANIMTAQIMEAQSDDLQTLLRSPHLFDAEEGLRIWAITVQADILALEKRMLSMVGRATVRCSSYINLVLHVGSVSKWRVDGWL